MEVLCCKYVKGYINKIWLLSYFGIFFIIYFYIMVFYIIDILDIF